MSHDHGPAETADLSPTFRWAVALNESYVVIELAAGLVTGSLALIADATLQIELGDQDQCRLRSEGVI